MTDSQVVLGLWPVAGITTVGVSESDAHETIEAAIDCGITTFDTAFSYGYEGQSDRLLGSMIRGERDRFQVIGKVGQRWTDDRRRVIDGSPQTLIADAETSLRRLGISRFDLLMLHSPDPKMPIGRSAQALADLQRRGLCDRVGACNVDLQQWTLFRQSAPCSAVQCPLNLIQRGSLVDLIPACRDQSCEVFVFWVLMKGLLAGRIGRDHQFAEGDPRPGYDIFQGRQRERAHQILDGMKVLADSSGLTIAQLSIGWTLAQHGVTAALVGARRAKQVRELSAAKALTADLVESIDRLASG